MHQKTRSETPDNPVAVETVELLQRRWLSKKAFEIELSRPPALTFIPGQTICFIHDSMERYYSLLSTPADASLSLCVYHVPHGSFSPVLADAPIGTQFSISGPHGYFTFNRSERAPVFVASGTGIAPFVSMVRSGVTDFILVHETESADDIYYQDLFHRHASNYTACLLETSAEDALPPNIHRGDAADFIKENLPPVGYDFYLCGERGMTRKVTLLVDEQFPGSYVFKEVYF